MHCYQLGDVSLNHSNECAGDIGSEVKARTAEKGKHPVGSFGEHRSAGWIGQPTASYHCVDIPND